MALSRNTLYTSLILSWMQYFKCACGVFIAQCSGWTAEFFFKSFFSTFCGDRVRETVVFWVKACTVRHLTSPSPHTHLVFLTLNRGQKWNLPEPDVLCFQSEGIVIFACGFQLHPLIPFAHFINSTAKQNLNIGFTPSAMFSPIHLFQVISDFCCPAVVCVLFCFLSWGGVGGSNFYIIPSALILCFASNLQRMFSQRRVVSFFHFICLKIVFYHWGGRFTPPRLCL